MKKFIMIVRLVFVFPWAVFTFFGPNTKSTGTNTKTEVVPDDSTTKNVTEGSPVIPGLKPVDVYLSMENEGFTTEKHFSSENNYYEWTSKNTVEGIDFRVETSGNKVDNVDRVRATAMIDPAIKKPEAALPFIKYVSSIPYEGSNPTQAVEWVSKNFNVNHAKTSIGGVSFEILAPTVAVRTLIVLPKESN